MTIMTIICAIITYLMKYFLEYTKLVNTIFIISVFVCYLVVVISVYSSVGFDDWNFQNTLPTANVSPFMFSTVVVLLFLPKTIKKYYLLLISLLSVGMFLSPTFNCIYNYQRDYRFIPTFLFDYLAHYLLFLFGIYIIRSHQVDLNIKNAIYGGLIVVCYAVLMMILNVIFDTSFFGLSLNGKHNIYNNVLVSNSYLSALLYFTGLIGVMALGYLFMLLFNKDKKIS